VRRSFGQHIHQGYRDRHIQAAWIGAGIVGGLNFIPGVLGAIAREPGAWGAMIEGAIYFALGYGVYRRHFAAGVALLAIFVLGRFAVGVMNGLVMVIILTYIFARAAKELWDLRAEKVAAASQRT
jgi:hypothetical protein